jgi:photosystem II stability/assembly factor-like uncharacterized protein
MHRSFRHPAFVLALAIFATAPLSAQRRSPAQGGGGAADLSDAALVNTVSVRSIGPAVMSGRVVDISVAASHGARGGSLGTVFYIAAASGGVWKTTNGGVTWTPVFDEAGVGSIGAVTVDPSNSDIVWVGTGESNNQRSSSYGDGIYKSVDGGETFANVGLPQSQHVGGILVHPGDSDVVYVAASGPMWAAGGERGVYKTTDGGGSWERVLFVDDHTGGIDIVMDPRNPDVLYAAMQQRERRAFSYISGGPGSGIWKTTDGGGSWSRLTDGLPTSDMGRIGLDIALSHPSTIYAVIEGSEQGVYRSDNGGIKWRKMSAQAAIPWYFGEIRVDPTDPETVYHLGVALTRSTDGGVNWERAASSVHADQHALWINPHNRDHLILGNDGGLYVSRDRGANWDFSPNLPISQFYAVGLDMAEPFFGIYGGLQDNSTWGGPSRTRAARGIFNSDWYGMAGGDGFHAAIDPTDDNIAYVESQNGNLIRYDKRTGDRKPIRPAPEPGDPAYRFNWSAPIKISPWDHNTVYFAANHLFKSPDRGDSWQVLGEDLTQAINRDSLEMMGSIPAADAVSRHQGVAAFGNIASIDVSQLQEGLLVTGSDDGVIAVSTDDGQTWNRQTSFPGVPDTAYVGKVRFSKHDASIVYATFDNHRSNDFHPYVIKSTDQGQTWQNITNDLADFGGVRAFAQHHENPDLLFVGTEIAPYVSLDGGDSWVRITNGMPPVRVDDIKIHPRDNALVIATHGRGFFVMDDLGPLQALAEAKAASGPFLVPVKSELQFTLDSSPHSGLNANRDYTVQNPRPGTTVSYYLPEAGGDVTLEIVGAAGDVVRTLDAEEGAGFHHVAWDFRWDAPYSGPPREQQQNRGFGGFGGFGGGGNQGAPAVPGRYTARLTVGDRVLEESFMVKKDDNVTLTDAQLAELFDVRMRQMRLNAKFTMAIRQSDELRDQVSQAKTAMEGASVPESLTQMADGLEDDLNEIRSKLGAGGGGGFRGGGGGRSGSPSLRQLLGVAGGVNRATAMPTEQEMRALNAVPDGLEAQVTALNALLGRVPAFFEALDTAGVPWTPGRPVR